MIVLALEEFAAKRRQSQTSLEDLLRPIVARALDGKINTDGYRELLDFVSDQWEIAYKDESGETSHIPATLRDEIGRTLRLTDRRAADENTIERVAVWLATLILSSATAVAAKDDPEDLFVEWVTMEDSDVRLAHKNAHGQQRPLGDAFVVGGKKMRWPGDPRAPIELWINCRCTLRPVLAEDVALVARNQPPGLRYVPPMITSSTNWIPTTTTSTHPTVRWTFAPQIDDIPFELWHADEQPEHQGETMSESAVEEPTEVEAPEAESEDATDVAPLEDIRVPWYAVLAPEGVRSGDRRRFTDRSLRARPLPLPISWQKMSSSGHDNSVTVARADRMVRVPTGEGVNEIRATGMMLMSPEADEVTGLIAEFGRFGISVDADDASFEMSEDEECMDFTDARIASASIVPIPAFAEAWIALGEPPEGFMDGEELGIVETADPEEEALVAAVFVDVAPGVTEDGPGWLTHPMDTDRLRDYWVRGPGAAKIAWGTPGDFNRCRINLAEYIKPQYLNGYCANRHKDAMGIWPGEHRSAKDALEFTEEAPSVGMSALVASVATHAPAEWFRDPELDGVTPLTITEEGRVFGHIAGWKTCHGAYEQCVVPPHSSTGYAHFLLGEVLTTEGTVPVGSLTIGGGHAGDRLRARAAREHYDNSCSVFADVTVGEDAHGIWCAGWVRPGTAPEMIHAARASKLSGDWRRIGGSMEMIAALAVNVPGYEILRVAASIHNGEQISLVAAGMVAEEPEVSAESIDLVALAALIVDETEARAKRREQMRALAERFNLIDAGIEA